MRNYKVCILAGGVASQMGELTKNIHSSILPINFKAVISYIIEKFPKDIEIVLALGHKKETVIDYVTLAHPDRKFTFVQSERFAGPGTGPGHALLECKQHLQCPFIFVTSDTIVLEEIPEPTENWFGIAPVKETERFCTVKIKNNLIYQLDDKIKTDNKFAFIGLAGVKDYEHFWDSLENNKDPIKGQIQVSNGFKKLIEHRLVPIGFTWFDTGSIEGYKETNKSFSGSDKAFDFGKSDEFIYFVNGKVVKYFADRNITENRHKRANTLKGLAPEINGLKGNFYSYDKVDGQVMYDVLDRQIVRDFLYWSKANLWKKSELAEQDKATFKKACTDFYKEKTQRRLKKFYEKTGLIDDWNIINGVRIPSLGEMVDKIDWDYVTNGTPVNFHGDFQFDNILVSRSSTNNLPKFTLLDWRQDFGGLIDHGDLYYDLAKLYGGTNISYRLIKKGDFSFDMSGQSAYYNYSIGNDLLEAREEFEDFILKNGFDLKKVKLITALIFLNMAPLHHSPFDMMLYFMGKSRLYTALKDMGKIQ